MNNKERLIKYILILLLSSSSNISYGLSWKKHWVIAILDSPYVIYWDKNSIRHINKKGKAYINFKTQLIPTPPHEVEKLYVISHVEYDCLNKSLIYTATTYALNVPIPKKEYDAQKYNEKHPSSYFYLFNELCKK